MEGGLLSVFGVFCFELASVSEGVGWSLFWQVWRGMAG